PAITILIRSVTASNLILDCGSSEWRRGRGNELVIQPPHTLQQRLDQQALVLGLEAPLRMSLKYSTSVRRRFTHSSSMYQRVKQRGVHVDRQIVPVGQSSDDSSQLAGYLLLQVSVDVFL
ncbi:hypothetical protein J6590_046301, partial [Homalodisca vitripennis]